ncbi:hypothetical protein TTRE_0000146901 [Trichuris trichiura]|uniref:Uncharacterized protein n=1 Tax=Trichuris trichiura TaxID=36087 RepID=A0A077Z3B6_TRITR|nr:hypothetical protein TTRE_0000146901 [Trichuris trichiura]
MEIVVFFRALLLMTCAYAGQNETIPPRTESSCSQNEHKWNSDVASDIFVDPISTRFSSAWLYMGLVDLMDTVIGMSANGIGMLRNAYISCLCVTLLLELLLFCTVLSYREWRDGQAADSKCSSKLMSNNATGSKLAPTRKYQSYSDSKCVGNGQDEEEANDSAKNRFVRSSPLRRSHLRSVNYPDMTPSLSNGKPRYRSLARNAHCQTVYSFPADFDLGLFFDSPLFLYFTDENDVTILNSVKADVSISSSELRQQLYSRSSNSSVGAGHGEASEDCVSSHESDEGSSSDKSSSSIDYVSQNVPLSAPAVDINDVSPEASLIIDADTDYNNVKRSSWNSEEYYNLEEHMSLDGLHLSPIATLEKRNSSFCENTNCWNSNEEESCSDDPVWIDCSPSTPRVELATQSRRAANGIHSFGFVSIVEKALEEMNLQCNS